MKKAFVTGGSGFVGRNLIRRLRHEGVAVAALARSESAANRVAQLGAVPVRGDLNDRESLAAGMTGCEVVFHAAAHVEEWGPREDFWRINVDGTQAVLDVAREAGVACFVHVGTEAIYADGKRSLANLDETAPVPDHPLPRYPATKAEAERRVLAANAEGFRCVSVRPRFIWGRDDSSVLPALIDAVRTGRFMWVDGGRPLSSSTHVDNVCEGLWLAAHKGRGGEAYFVADGPPIPYRELFGGLFEACGVPAPQREMPLWAVRGFARVTEALWDTLGLRSTPPATRMMLELGAREVTIRDDKARRELGYAPIISREEGLQTLAPTLS